MKRILALLLAAMAAVAWAGDVPADYVPLKEHVEARIADLERMSAIASAQMEKRLDSMNEFRAALRDQTEQALTRKEHSLFSSNLDERLKDINADVRMLRESKAELAGKASQEQFLITIILAVLSLAISAVTFFFKHRTL